jgi:hypothetical protein
MPESAMPAVLAAPSNGPAHPRNRPGRNRAGGLAATVLSLTLLAAGAAGCSSGGGSGDQKSSGGSTAAATPTGIQVPAKIGTLTKLAGPDKFGLPDDGIPKSVRKNLHDVTYYTDAHDVSSPHVNVRGGLGMPYPSDGPPDKIRRLFSEWDLSLHSDQAAKVPSGSVGGLAECAPSAVSKDFSCGWISGKVALVMDFNGYSHDEVTALLPKILEAMVTS